MFPLLPTCSHYYLRFSDVFRGYKKGKLGRNGLKGEAPGAYLEPCQTFMMERFCENSLRLLAIKYLHKSSPPQMFDRVLKIRSWAQESKSV